MSKKNFIFLISLFNLLWFSSARAEKTDVVILNNGDYITGEVKNLDFGLLEFKTDNMSTLSIEWDAIFSIIALNQYFRLEKADGRLLYGSLDTDTVNYKLLVVLDTTRVPLEFNEVIRITPIKETIWDRMDINVDVGYSYTKASTVSQLTFNGKVLYRAYRNSAQLTIGSIDTDQKDKPQTKRLDLNLSGKHIFRKRWFLTTGLGMQQNTELGLDLRVSWSTGAGRYALQTHHSLLLGNAGISVNREYNQNAQNSYNLEGIFTVEFYRFIYQTPKFSLDSYLNIYPGLSDWGRLRSELDVKLKWEIIADLYWNLTFYSSTDNRPPSGEGAKFDYGVTVSIGIKL